MKKIIYFYLLFFVGIINAATIDVKVYNVNNNSVPGALVKLYNNQWTLIGTANTNNTGKATFSGLSYGTYHYEVYYTGAVQEFWGGKEDLNLYQSKITSNFTRSWPYRYEINSLSDIVVGEQATYQITVKNGLSFARDVKVEIWIDRDQQSSWDFHQLSQAVTVDGNTTGNINFSFTPQDSGTYYCKMNILTYNNGAADYIVSDSYGWTVSFEATETLPVNSGFMIYHSYSDYEAWDSNLYMFDFSSKVKTAISQGWNIDHEMNAHISPDGTKIVFMGDNAGSPRDWDIYLWEIGSANQPANLTSVNGLRDEDPKFSPDGTKIIFKQAGDIKEMNLSGTIVNSITTDGYTVEESMPYYTTNGSKVIYAQGAGENSDIYIMNTDGTNKTVMFNVSQVTEYYPIVRDDTTFFYSKWISAYNQNDQIMLGNLQNSTNTVLSVNDVNSNNSDAYPVGSDYLIFTSTRSGGIGGYDLYLGQVSTGSVWNLNDYGVNSSIEELGPCYFLSTPINQTQEMKTNINETTKQHISVYPNPSKGNFIITGKQLNRIEIIGLDGKMLKTQIPSSNLGSINVSDLRTGVYFLKAITLDDKIYIQKIIVE